MNKLFRVYILDHKRFSYFDLNNFEFSDFSKFNYQDRHLYSQKYPIQQYTGLNDKNKAPIYEGDIIDFTARYKQDGPAEVIFYGGSYGCIIFDDGGLKEFWRLHDIVQQHYPEIIGNIFDNPELLEDCPVAKEL